MYSPLAVALAVAEAEETPVESEAHRCGRKKRSGLDTCWGTRGADVAEYQHSGLVLRHDSTGGT